MANLKEIRNRIQGVKNTAKITSAMKMVSAAKLKRAQDAIESARPYVLKLNDVLGNLVENVGESYDNPLSQKRDEVNNVAVIVVTSDRGLCGSFNTNLIKESWAFVSETVKQNHPNAKIDIVACGKKAVGFYKKQSDFEVIANYPDIFAKLEFDTAKKIVDEVKETYISGNYDRVFVLVNEFVNVVTQVPKRHQLLPIETSSEENEESNFVTDYIFEPSQNEILDELLPKILNISMWRYLLESNAAEHASRMMAMDNATNNAKDLVEQLNLTYNKERQAAITTEMLEIVGGANALENA
jgi:F-type H+-transporting ATPase subunit gamma